MAARVKGKPEQISDNVIPPLQLVLAFTRRSAVFAFLPIVSANARLEWSILSATGTLLLFWCFLAQAGG